MTPRDGATGAPVRESTRRGRRAKVVLYNPRAVFDTMPLALMAVASHLDRTRFKDGGEIPQTLDEWAAFDFVGSVGGPWVSPEKFRRVELFRRAERLS